MERGQTIRLMDGRLARNRICYRLVMAGVLPCAALTWLAAACGWAAELVPLTQPQATFHAGGKNQLQQVIDGVEAGPGGWSVAPRLSKPQALVFRCVRPVEAAELDVAMFFLSGRPNNSIAEFALSYTTDAAPSLGGSWQPLDIQRFAAEVATLQRTETGHLRAVEVPRRLVTGTVPDDVYRIGVLLPHGRATGFRLEVFPVTGSPNAKPRMSWGEPFDFVLTEFRLEVRQRETTNIALHCPVTASHLLYGSMQPGALTDGLPATIAHPSDPNIGPEFYFDVDLGRLVRLDHIGLRTRGDGHIEPFTRMRVRLYETAPTAGAAVLWDGMVRADGTFPPAGTTEILRSTTGQGEFNGRFIRISSDSKVPTSPQLAEVEVYETRTPEVVAVLADGRDVDFSQGLDLAPGVRRLSIQLRIPQLGMPPQEMFRWRVNNEWNDWQSSSLLTVDLASPRPGKTVFEAQALHSDGQWDQSILRLPIHARQHLMANLWFQVAAGSTILFLAMGLVRAATTRRTARQLVLAQARAGLAEERTRIARDLHDDLGANLALIGFLTDQAGHALSDPDRARQQLDKINHATRDLTQQLGSVVWAVDPANDTLESLARYLHGYAGEYLGMAGIRCHFTSTEEMPALHLTSIFRHHLLMIVKEALHNVVSHSRASLVTFSIRVENDQLMLELADNGCGMPLPEDLKPGNGLENMRKRAEALGGSCDVLTAGEGKGTLIRLTMVLKSAGTLR